MTNKELIAIIQTEIKSRWDYYKQKEDRAWDEMENGDEDALWYQGHRKMCAQLLAYLDTLERTVSDQEPSLEQLPYDNLMALYKSVQLEIRRRADELTIHIEEKPYQK